MAAQVQEPPSWGEGAAILEEGCRVGGVLGAAILGRGAVGKGSHFGCGGGHFLLGAAILGSGGRHIAERKLPSWGVGAAILEGQVAIF